MKKHFKKVATLHRVLVVLTLLFSTVANAQNANAQSWQPIRGGIQNNISGMTMVSQTDSASKFLVVHDNKLPTESRAALVETSPNGESRFTALTWTSPDNISPPTLPIDLEAVCAVPQKPNEFLALSSSGAGFHIRLDEATKSLQVLKNFTLPQVPAGANFESFDVKQIGGALIAFWAHRGNGIVPATLYWARLKLNTLTFSETQSALVSAPFPSVAATSSTRAVGEVRHVSDLRVDNSGVLYCAAASDAGDDGPFSSSLYIAGTFFRVGNAIQFEGNAAPIVLRKFKYRKVEALEILPNADGIVVGTDDENMGSSVCFVAQ